MKNIRIAYANTAITLEPSQTLNLWDSQFVNCQNAFSFSSGTTANVENGLFFNLDGWATGGQSATTVNGINVTVHNCNTPTSLGANSAVNLTNSLLAAVTNQFNPSPSLDSTANVLSDAGIFMTLGAASHYLAPNSIHRNQGTLSISDGLRARLRQKTTFPPRVLETNFTANTTLGSRNLQDVDAIDRGFHYDVIDYAWSGLLLTNATLTLTNGVAVAAYGSKGTTLHNAAKFISEGRPRNLNRLVRYNTVQEQANTNWTTSSSSISLLDVVLSTPPEVRLKFTDASVLADTTIKRDLVKLGGLRVIPLSLTHCQLRGVHLDVYSTSGEGMTVALTNNFIQRSFLSFYQENIPGYYPFTLTCYNNLFRSGKADLNYRDSATTWTVKDNLFDTVSLTSGSFIANSNNGYSTNTTKLPGSTGGDVTITNFDYQASALGNFYYPTTGTDLARLINAGSRSASSAGLSNYTTTTDQTAEGATTVDIGYHYLATDPNMVVTIANTTPAQNAREPDDQFGAGRINGRFTVTRTGSTASSLNFFYTVSGTAINGTDYDTLSGTATIQQGFDSQNIDVVPKFDTLLELPETVTAALLLTNSYTLGPEDRATVSIQDSTPVTFTTFVSGLNAPIGIDYHQPQNSLIVSLNFATGLPKNFARISSTGGQSDWSTVSGLQQEIKLTTVKSTANGFTLGDLYYNTANAGQIGKMLADGSNPNNSWVNLPNELITVHGLYIDQTGIFAGDLIAVTGDGVQGGGVWRVTSAQNATKVAQINDDPLGRGAPLEGVITLANDPGKYGPWAGKMLIGAERQHNLFTIDTNRVVTPFEFEGQVEDIELIPSSQNLYCIDVGPGGPNGRILKVASSNFSDYIGDLLITIEGDEGDTPRLAIVHWDGANFVVRDIVNNGTPGVTQFEHVTFAPF